MAEKTPKQKARAKKAAYKKVVTDFDNEMVDLSKSLSQLGKGFSKLLGVGTQAGEIADHVAGEQVTTLKKSHKLLMKNQRVVNDRFKTLSKELGLTKDLNIYQSAAVDISDQLKDDAKKKETDTTKLSKEERKILKTQRRQLRIMGKVHSVNEAITDTMGEQSAAIKGMYKSATIFMNPLTAVFGILGASIARVFTLETALFSGATSAGALKTQMASTATFIEQNELGLLRQGVSLEKANQIAGELAKEQGLITKDGGKFAVELASATEKLGMGASESAKLAASMKNIFGFTSDTVGAGIDTMIQDAAAAGVPLAQIMDEVANATDTTAGLFAKNPKELLKASIEARGLGLTMTQITSNLDNITDIQGTFNKQAELSALLGRNVNLLQVNGLMLQGKTTDAVKLYNSQVFESVKASERQSEFNEMSIIQQRKIAEGLGMTIKGYQKSLAIQADRANMTSAEIKSMDAELKRQDQLKARGQVLLASITRVFSPVINDLMEGVMDGLDTIDFSGIASSLREFFAGDRIKNFIQSLTSGFKTVMGYAGKIFGFMYDNPMMSAGLIAGFFALKKGIGMLTGGAFGPISKALPMALKALPAIGGVAALIAAGMIAVRNLSTLFGGKDKADRAEKTKALSSHAGMMVGAGIGAIFGPIGVAIGAALGGFIGGTDFGQKLFRGIFPEGTITKMIAMFDNLRFAGDELFRVFSSTEGEGLGQRIGKALRAAFDAIEWKKLFGTGATIIEDMLIFLTDIAGGIFGVDGLGKTLATQMRLGIDMVISYVKSIPDKFKLMGMKLSLAIDKMLRIDNRFMTLGASEAELAKQEADIANFDMKIKQQYLKGITTDRVIGDKVDDAIITTDRVIGDKVDDAIIKPDGQVIKFNPNDTALLTKEGIAPDMSETNELLRQLISQGGGQAPIQLNIDGKKVGQAIAKSGLRE